jgi:hypothetical protein
MCVRRRACGLQLDLASLERFGDVALRHSSSPLRACLVSRARLAGLHRRAWGTLALFARLPCTTAAAPPALLPARSLCRAAGPLPPLLRFACALAAPPFAGGARRGRHRSAQPPRCQARQVVDARDAAVVRQPLIAAPMGKGPRRMSSAAGSSGPAAPVHTSAHVQLLGLGLDDSGVLPSVMLFFDHSRYLFNVGEGFQARPSRRCRRAHVLGLGLLRSC